MSGIRPPCPRCGIPVLNARWDIEEGAWVEHYGWDEDCPATYTQIQFLGRWFQEAKRDAAREQWPDSYELTTETQLRQRIAELTSAGRASEGTEGT